MTYGTSFTTITCAGLLRMAPIRAGPPWVPRRMRRVGFCGVICPHAAPDTSRAADAPRKWRRDIDMASSSLVEPDAARLLHGRLHLFQRLGEPAVVDEALRLGRQAFHARPCILFPELRAQHAFAAVDE